MTENTQPETTKINEYSIADFVVTMAKEDDGLEMNIPREVESDDVWDGLTGRNVDRVDSFGNGVEVEGSYTVREVTGRIPASGGGRFDPPTNPPETLYTEREASFVFQFTFEDIGTVTGSVEVM